MKITTKLVAIAAAGTLWSGVASAQNTFNYFTTGQFTSSYAGCNNAVPSTTVPSTNFSTFCGTGAPGTAGAFGLQFVGSQPAPVGYMTGTNLSYGFFQPYGNFSASTSTLGPINFTLFINQTNPTTGQASVTGAFTGSITTGSAGAEYSDLYWMPTSNTATIGAVNYFLAQNGAPLTSLRIGPDQGPGGVTSINGYATVTPEPSSLALLGTGLVGLVPMIRRRRNNG